MKKKLNKKLKIKRNGEEWILDRKRVQKNLKIRVGGVCLLSKQGPTEPRTSKDMPTWIAVPLLAYATLGPTHAFLYTSGQRQLSCQVSGLHAWSLLSPDSTLMGTRDFMHSGAHPTTGIGRYVYLSPSLSVSRFRRRLLNLFDSLPSPPTPSLRLFHYHKCKLQLLLSYLENSALLNNKLIITILNSDLNY